MITKLRVSNFKAVSGIELALGTVNVLVGANNSGKTSIIHAIQFCVSSSQSAAMNSSAKWVGPDYDTTLGPEQLLWSPTDNAFALANSSLLTRTKPIQLTLDSDNGDTCTIELARGKNRNLTVRLKGDALGKQIQSIDAPFSVYVPGLAGISVTERYLSPGLVRRMVAQGDANLAFRNVLLLLKQNEEKWKAFQRRLRALFPEYEISVAFSHDYDEYITVATKHVTGDERPIDTAGTGMLQVMQVLAYVGLYEPRLLLLDEPDSHLHPNNQRSLCEVVKRLAEESDTQIIISTHSQHIMEALQVSSKLHWIQAGKVVDDVETSRIPILADLGALGLQDSLISGKTRCLVLTEDMQRDALRTLLESSGFDMKETAVESYAGCSNIVAARVLAEFVKSIAPGVRVVVHRDRDGMTEGEKADYINELSVDGINAFVTMGNDIESYFLTPEHIAASCTDVSLEEAQQILNEVIEELADHSKRRLINLRNERNFKVKSDDREDVGTISVKAFDDYNGDPFLFTHSKKAMSVLCGRIQAKIGKNVKLVNISAHLRDSQLEQLVLELWPT